MRALLYQLAPEVQEAVGVAAHERDIVPGRGGTLPRGARDGRGRDVDVLKGVDLPGLLLPVATLDP